MQAWVDCKSKSLDTWSIDKIFQCLPSDVLFCIFATFTLSKFSLIQLWTNPAMDYLGRKVQLALCKI